MKWYKVILWTIGIVLALIAISTPIYIYWKDFHSLNRSGNPNDWGTFGDFIGGILNPIISFLTLIVSIIIALELKKIEERNRDREIQASYFPQLVFESSIFYTYAGEKVGLLKPVEFSHISKGYSYKSDLTFPNIFGVDLYNIGLGPAKNIEITFRSDIYKLVAMIQEMSQEIDSEKVINVGISKGKKQIMLEVEYPKLMNIGRSMFMISDQKIKISHLLNVTVSSQPFYLKLPHFLLELYTIYQYTWHEYLHSSKEKLDASDFIPVYLNVKFEDIGTNNFQKNFMIQIQIVHGGLMQFTNELKVSEVRETV